jgi:hypothetical protein
VQLWYVQIELKCYRFKLNFLLRVFKLFEMCHVDNGRPIVYFGIVAYLAWPDQYQQVWMADGPWYVRRGLAAAWVQCYQVGRSR